MNRDELVESPSMAAIRKIALSYPEVEEGTSCVNRAFKVRTKTFVFLGMNQDSYNVRLKLKDSLDDASEREKKSPDHFSVGAHGWTLVTFPHSKRPPKGLMERWIDESFRLLAPKSVVAEVPAR